MRILISGYCGQMGREIARLAAGRNIEVACGVDVNAPENDPVCVRSFDEVTVPVDCVVDFSFHTNAFAVTDFAVKNNLPLAMGTTGLTQEEKAAVEAASEKIPVLFTSNFSLGVALMNELVKIAARVMPDTEIAARREHRDRGSPPQPQGRRPKRNRGNPGGKHYIRTSGASRKLRQKRHVQKAAGRNRR